VVFKQDEYLIERKVAEIASCLASLSRRLHALHGAPLCFGVLTVLVDSGPFAVSFSNPASMAGFLPQCYYGVLILIYGTGYSMRSYRCLSTNFRKAIYLPKFYVVFRVPIEIALQLFKYRPIVQDW
jgi:hypothetical protein